MLNLVIAIMSDTYANLIQLQQGIYFQGVIKAIAFYKNNKHYGGLISSLPVLNVLIVPFVPFYLGITDRVKLRSMTNFI